MPKKRVADLLAARALARRERPEARALIVGDGVEAERLRGLAAQLGVPATFAGFLNQTEISRAYVAADCLVLPSDVRETWGLVVNEAMVHGRPAIVSDRVGCGPDLVSDGETGSGFPCADQEALARAIGDVAASAELRRAMGERARARVAQYSVDRAIRGTREGIAFATGAAMGAVA